MGLLSGTRWGRGTRGRSPVRWRPQGGRPHTSTVQRGSPPGCADATMDILGFLRVSSWNDIEVRGGATGTAAQAWQSPGEGASPAHSTIRWRFPRVIRTHTRERRVRFPAPRDSSHCAPAPPPAAASPPAACSGYAGWACSCGQTAAARSHSCPRSPGEQRLLAAPAGASRPATHLPSC